MTTPRRPGPGRPPSGKTPRESLRIPPDLADAIARRVAEERRRLPRVSRAVVVEGLIRAGLACTGGHGEGEG